jgi:putative ABC transport system substrate-binding protein
MTRCLIGRLVTLALGLLVAPLAVEAQPAGKVYRIGMLETRSTVLNAANIDAFRQGLLELGYKEGQNLEIVYRSSDGRDEQFPGLASELVRLQVDLLLTRGTPAALAAKSASRTIPIVMAASGDPVVTGVVASPARPGGNVTGLSSAVPELNVKQVELLREVFPTLARIAVLMNMGNPVHPPQWSEVEATARALGIEPQLFDVRRPEDLPRLFEAAAEQRAVGHLQHRRRRYVRPGQDQSAAGGECLNHGGQHQPFRVDHRGNYRTTEWRGALGDHICQSRG